MNKRKELMPAKIGASGRREGSAKAAVADHISQTIKSTSNLLQSSSSQVQLTKLPKNLLAKTSTIKDTEQALNQMPPVISSLDLQMEKGLQSGARLNTILQLIETIRICQLKPLTSTQVSPEEPILTDAQPSEAD